jgi:hypothetical protein
MNFHGGLLSSGAIAVTLPGPQPPPRLIDAVLDVV